MALKRSTAISRKTSARVLAAFRKGEVRMLVATDIAARGIDVDGVSHVVNFDLPNGPETYVHRIGGTARARVEGIAMSLCDSKEVVLRDIEKLIRMTIPVSGKAAHREGAKPAAPTNTFIKSRRNAKQRHGRNGAVPNQRHRGQANEAPRDVASVAFMRGKEQPHRDRGLRAPGWRNSSQGS